MSSSDFELSVENQFDYLCKLGLTNEKRSYYKQNYNLSKKEVNFSEIGEYLINQIPILDTYSIDFNFIDVFGLSFGIENESLNQAIQTLSDKEQNIIALYYLFGFNDVEIGTILSLERSTINRHRHKILPLIKKVMEDQ